MLDYQEIQQILAELSQRVAISRLKPEDENNFLQMAHSSKEIHTPWVFPPADTEAFKELLERNTQNNFETVVIRPKGETNIIGIFNLSQIFYHNFQNTILGCYTNMFYHGQGYMREGLLQTMAYAFFNLKLHRIEANIMCDNFRSIKFFKTLGFRHEGMSKNYLFVNGAWRDHEKFALTVEDWDTVLSTYKDSKK